MRVWQSIGSSDRYDDPLTRPVLVARGVIYRERVDVCAEHRVNKLGVGVKPFGPVEVFVVVLKVMDVIGLHLVKCVCRPRIAQQIIELGTPNPIIRTVAIKRDPSIDKPHYLKR